MSGHVLHLDPLRIECNEPEGAICRIWCPEDCEDWSRDNHDGKEGRHGLIAYPRGCLGAEWVSEAADDFYTCAADESDEPVEGMAVHLVWDDGWMWEPDEQPEPVA